MVGFDGEVDFGESAVVGRFVEDFPEEGGNLSGRVPEGPAAEGGEDQHPVVEPCGDVQDCPDLVLHAGFFLGRVVAVRPQVGSVEGGHCHKACRKLLVQKRVAVRFQASEYGYVRGVDAAEVPVHGIEAAERVERPVVVRGAEKAFLLCSRAVFDSASGIAAVCHVQHKRVLAGEFSCGKEAVFTHYIDGSVLDRIPDGFQV